MPKRSNAFQRLVFLVQKALEDQFDVLESEYLCDRTTGARREVDIVIRAKAGAHPIVIGIECVGSGRRASVEWVERMRGKHEHLTDKLILVSARGFYPEALAKAARLGIETHTLDALLEDPGQLSVLADQFQMWQTDLYTPTCQLVFSDSPDGAELDDPIIYNGDGSPWGTVNEIWKKVRQGPEFWKAVRKLGMDGVRHVELNFDLAEGSHILARDGREVGVLRMLILADLTQQSASIPLNQKSFAGRRIAHGAIEGQMPGEQIVIVEREDASLSILYDLGKNDVRRL